MSHPYPYTCTTPVPKIQYEEYNGARFAYVNWPAATEQTKGCVFIVHGFCEHIKLNHRLMDHLALMGYESFMFDQRGSGMTSPGKLRGITNEKLVFDDLDHFLLKNLERCAASATPVFLYGHSMGGGIVLNYACHGTHRGRVAGFSTTGPLIELHPSAKPMWITTKLSPLLARFLPNMRIDTKLNLDGISSDPDYRAFLQYDRPLSTPLIGSLRQIYDFLQRGKALLDDKYVQDHFVRDKPVLIIHGACDTINDPAASKRFIDHVCPATDRTLKLIEEARHSILSLEKDVFFNEAFNCFYAWLDQHVPAAN
ncbi:hypothetical protein HG537_0A04170 [Torulaspora globosa]|uniref:Serine aminopeptidase S33 domain-containing protein n=1 Tax=Torulaspora globosa TaxID=48254 RepID=A0A7H9HLF6_9SACH|nr:hypothetical protein HG537_0A04170 [Torulaspora sp. CBS 2947]